MSMTEANQFEHLSLCSAVVTTWRRPVLLKDTIESLSRQSYPHVEIIVVCDGEDADVRAMARVFQTERELRWVFHSENRGLAASRNTGVHEAAGDVVLFFDDDVVADPDCIAAHMAHHLAVDERRTQVVCGDNTEDMDRPLSTYLDKCLFEMWNQIRGDGTKLLAKPDVDWMSDELQRSVWCGLNCSMRRDLFLKSGGFNESFRSADEEMELGERLYLAGFEFIFEPGALLEHRNTKDLATYSRNVWRTRGALDCHRVFDLQQRTAQTQQLVSIYHGYLSDRITARCAWHLSEPLQTVANWLEAAANRTKWHLFSGAWARTSRASDYWGGIKASGRTLQSLKGVTGPSKRAIMLHSICEPLSGEEASYYVAPRRFHRLMRWFRSTGYRTATTAQWLQDDVSDEQVLLTFDDGYDDLYTELFPLVIEHKYTAVIYLVAERIGASNVWDQETGLRARNLLTLEQIREMMKHGVEFGSHTLTHPWLPGVSDAQLRREVIDSKHRLEDMLGIEITSLAYPFGGVDQRVRSAVAQAGYKLAFTVAAGTNWWNDPLCQRRAEVNDYTTVLDFAFKLRNGRGLRQSLAARLRSLEQDLPFRGLRKVVGALRSTGHKVVQNDGSGRVR